MLCWQLISRNQWICDSDNASSPNEALSDVSEAKNPQGKPQATDSPEESFKELWKKKTLLRTLQTAGERPFPGQHHPTRRLDSGVRNLLAELSRTSWLSLRRTPQGQPPQPKTAVTGLRLRSVRIDGESRCHGVPRIPALKHQQHATTNGHRCSWAHLHCWCAEVATPDRANAAEFHLQAGFPPTCWECPQADR